MRLSTDPARDEARGVAVLLAALDAGIELLDTADAYCWDDEERGHNERLIARALSEWAGDRRGVRIATKGGLTRPHGRWAADGRAKHLRAACEASLRALGVERIDLYQLHAPDPRTPIATSVRALAALKRGGLVGAIGLCNVTVPQIEEARGITEIEAVQVELSVWHHDHLFSGVVDYCIANGITLLAHRPLGGPQRRQKTSSDPTLLDVASRHGATPFEIALAWVRHLGPNIIPIPGATRVETVHSIARASAIVLSDDDRAQLEARFPTTRGRRSLTVAVTPRTDGEVVLVMGIPGAGKSTLASEFTARGYERLNRDEAKGSLRDLIPLLDRTLASERPFVVLDNTYASRRSRAEVIAAASVRGVPTRCVWVRTSVEDAQTNAARRLVERYGRLPGGDDLARLRRTDVAAFPPSVLFRYQRELEPPDPSEGFSRIEHIDFARRVDPTFTSRAVLVWCDGILMRSRAGHRAPESVDDVEVVAGRGERLRRCRDEGWLVLGISWQPEVADGTRDAAAVDAIIARMNALLGIDVEVEYCPHAAGPPTCWCRKPLPGLGVLFTVRHRLNPAECVYVGAGSQDPGFARKLGFRYHRADEFFGTAT